MDVPAFRERLLRLAPKDPLVLAVSGGGDSVALALLVKEAGRQAVVAHLDHGLRPESPLDQAFVRALAERLGFPFFTERVEVARIAQARGENLEAVAREVRYAFLHRVAREVGARAILTAHTLDDQAETVLLQLLQGTARATGIREREGIVVRPLLAHTREELRAYLRARGEAWREDPTNQDPALDRNFLRLFVFPLLEERFPAAKRALARFAEARAEEEGVLERQAEARLLPDPRFFVPAFRAAPLLEAPLAVRRRALRRLLEKLGLRPEARLVLLLEGAHALEAPEDLRPLRKRGLRLLSLTWATGNAYAGGNAEPGPLTAKGRALLEAMAALGVALDLSHLAEEAAWEALRVYEGPVCATHANCRALVPSERHLSDGLLRALAGREGVLGLVPFNAFLDPAWKRGMARLPLEAFFRHKAHAEALMGGGRVGLGTDWDGGFGLEAVPQGLDRHRDLRALGDEGFLGGNWLRWLLGWF